jgi:quaternary ammonium compound-resistance protein SugE
MSSAWSILFVAGVLEVCWTICLKYSEGFTRLIPSLLTLPALIVGMYLLSRAVQTLPIGTAYAVWVGIGAVGAAGLGMILFAEPVSVMRIGFLGLLVVSIVGLRVTAG